MYTISLLHDVEYCPRPTNNGQFSLADVNNVRSLYTALHHSTASDRSISIHQGIWMHIHRNVSLKFSITNAVRQSKSGTILMNWKRKRYCWNVDFGIHFMRCRIEHCCWYLLCVRRIFTVCLASVHPGEQRALNMAKACLDRAMAPFPCYYNTPFGHTIASHLIASYRVAENTPLSSCPLLSAQRQWSHQSALQA